MTQSGSQAHRSTPDIAEPTASLGSILIPPLVWPLSVILLATLAVSGMFSFSRVFYLRDLAGYFWPHHLWLRQTVWSGHLPLWAPGAGLGYATVAEPNLQLFFPLTMVARLMLPDVAGFNLMVALPAPLGALGAFLFLRHRFTAPGAAVGAIVFALSGPFLSTLTFPNLAFSAALVPWSLWTLERFLAHPSLQSGVVLAVAFAMEALAGEYVTLLGVAAGSIGYAALMAPPTSSFAQGRLRIALRVSGWGIAGALLAAVQMLPLIDAMSRSPRATGMLIDGWSIHPLALLEAVSPALFGSPVDPVSAWSPWLFPLNGGQEPFLGSLYVGPGALALAMIGAFEGTRRRWTAVWSVALLVGLVLSLGYFTPVYPWLRSRVPLFSSLRYPAKFMVFAALALGCLAAAGSDVLLGGGRDGKRRGRVVVILLLTAGAGIACLGLVTVLAAPGVAAALMERLAAQVGLSDPRDGSVYLMRSMIVALPRLVVTTVASALLLWGTTLGGRAARIAGAALLAATVLDPLAANESLNPTVATTWLQEPGWVAATRAHREDRVYSGLAAILPKGDAELPETIAVDPQTPAPAVTALVSTALATFPMAWGLPGALTPDLTRLRPAAYSVLIERFAASDREGRLRFLNRIGTRYHLALAPPSPPSVRLAAVDGLPPMALYEDPRPGPRALIVASYRIVPDTSTRIAALFDPRPGPDREVLLGAAPPAPVGAPGTPMAFDAAAIVEEWPTGMRVEADVASSDAFLVVRDAYDPNWVASVDGTVAPMLEADGFFRAVRVPGGHHQIVFRYRSHPFLIGVSLSIAAALALIACGIVGRGRRPKMS